MFLLSSSCRRNLSVAPRKSENEIVCGDFETIFRFTLFDIFIRCQQSCVCARKMPPKWKQWPFCHALKRSLYVRNLFFCCIFHVFFSLFHSFHSVVRDNMTKMACIERSDEFYCVCFVQQYLTKQKFASEQFVYFIEKKKHNLDYYLSRMWRMVCVQCSCHVYVYVHAIAHFSFGIFLFHRHSQPSSSCSSREYYIIKATHTQRQK